VTHRQPAELDGSLRIAGATLAQVPLPKRHIIQPGQALAHGIGIRHATVLLAGADPQLEQSSVYARLLEDLEGVGQAHRLPRARLKQHDLERLVGAPIHAGKRRRHRVASDRRPAQRRQRTEERWPDVEAESGVSPRLPKVMSHHLPTNDYRLVTRHLRRRRAVRSGRRQKQQRQKDDRLAAQL
jgi:hypothetical protein